MVPLFTLGSAELRALARLDGLVDAITAVARDGHTPALAGAHVRPCHAHPHFILKVLGLREDGTIAEQDDFLVPEGDIAAAVVVARLVLRGLREDLLASLQSMATSAGLDPLDAGLVEVGHVRVSHGLG